MTKDLKSRSNAKGIAFSTGETLDFLEIFAPTTIAKYKRDIYKAVPAFIK